MKNLVENSMCESLYNDFKKSNLYIICMIGMPFERAFMLYLTAQGLTIETARYIISLFCETFSEEKKNIESFVGSFVKKPSCFYCDKCEGKCHKGINKSSVFCPFEKIE